MDTSFASNGIASLNAEDVVADPRTGFSDDDKGVSMALQYDGKILGLGYFDSSSSGSIAYII